MSDEFDIDVDTIRLGVVPQSLNNNPLLQKAVVGRAKANPNVPDMVFGVKSKGNDGGTAAVLGKGRAETPLENEALRRARERNPLLRKPEVGRARDASSEEVVNMIHGMKVEKHDSVSDTISTWYTPSTDNSRRRRPEVGRAKQPLDPHTAEITHGIKNTKKDGGTAEVLSGWNAKAGKARETQNPLLIKAEVGRAKHTLSADMADQIWGMKSKDPTVEGGVSGALGNWKRPDTREINKNRSQKLYKAELGKSKPPMEEEALNVVHGKKNVKVDGGTGEALSNWRPSTPKAYSRIHYEVNKESLFGKPSGEKEPIGDLMKHNYGKKWLIEQYYKQQNEQQQQPPKSASAMDFGE